MRIFRLQTMFLVEKKLKCCRKQEMLKNLNKMQISVQLFEDEWTEYAYYIQPT